MLELKPYEIEFDAEPVARRIGLIALATDHTTEQDFTRINNPDEAGVYVSRIAFENPTTVENLRLMGPRLTSAAALMLPGETLDVIAFSCTSASVVLGDEAVTGFIQAAKPGVQCVTPAIASLAAFEALDVRRISILTPYIADVTTKITTYFSDSGADIISSKCLGYEDDRDMARIKLTSIIEAGVDAMDDDAEALFISCTALRAAGCVEALEQRIGKPVITSNQAMIWRSLRLAGIERSVSGYGRLFGI